MCVKVRVQTWSQIEIVANGQLPDFAPDIGGESLPPHVPRLLRPFPTIFTGSIVTQETNYNVEWFIEVRTSMVMSLNTVKPEKVLMQ